MSTPTCIGKSPLRIARTDVEVPILVVRLSGDRTGDTIAARWMASGESATDLTGKPDFGTPVYDSDLDKTAAILRVTPSQIGSWYVAIDWTPEDGDRRTMGAVQLDVLDYVGKAADALIIDITDAGAVVAATIPAALIGGGGGGGASTFLGLTDTINSYAGQGGKVLAVKVTEDGVEAIEIPAGGGAVSSVNGQTGAVVLDAEDVGAAPTVHTHTLSQITDAGTAAAADAADFATAAQGSLADSAVQPGDLASVATSGAYADLSGTPTLATVATTGAYSDLSGAPSLAAVATTGAIADTTGTLAINRGGTGATTAAGARSALGLGSFAVEAVANAPTITHYTGTAQVGQAWLSGTSGGVGGLNVARILAAASTQSDPGITVEAQQAGGLVRLKTTTGDLSFSGAALTASITGASQAWTLSYDGFNDVQSSVLSVGGTTALTVNRSGAGAITFAGGTSAWGVQPSQSDAASLRVGVSGSGTGLFIGGSGSVTGDYFRVETQFGTNLFSVGPSGPNLGNSQIAMGGGFAAGVSFNLTGVTDRALVGSSTTTAPILGVIDARGSGADRTSPAVRFGTGTNPVPGTARGGIGFSGPDNATRSVTHYAHDGSAFVNAWTYSHDGSDLKMAWFGATPVARPTINSSTATVADVIALLVSLGLAEDTA